MAIFQTASKISPADPCERTEILVEKDHDLIVSRRTRVFRGFAWGQEIIKEVKEANGEMNMTTYTYYQNPAEKNKYRQVQTVIHPDGSWETFDYDRKDFFSPLVKRVVARGTAGTNKSR
jgi:hypothetical protein